jgi:hypothetical protein
MHWMSAEGRRPNCSTQRRAHNARISTTSRAILNVQAICGSPLLKIPTHSARLHALPSHAHKAGLVARPSLFSTQHPVHEKHKERKARSVKNTPRPLMMVYTGEIQINATAWTKYTARTTLHDTTPTKQHYSLTTSVEQNTRVRA